MGTIEGCRRRVSAALTAFILIGGGLLFAPRAASAQTCIQDVWKAHGHNQNLTCTAQDVTLSSATNINIVTGGKCEIRNGVRVCECDAGGTVTFTADFQMDLTADTRYDVGFYIETGADNSNDGAITGQCTAVASLLSNTTRTGNFINLDAAPDVCGDITGPFETAHNPLFVTATISTQCPLTPGEQLQLDFATTWRQPGSNQVCAGTGNGTTTNDVFPGSPSKCNTGTLAIDIVSRPTVINVEKTYAGTGVFEDTGGAATYNVTVSNPSAIAVTLQSLSDVPYGDITQVQGAVTNTTCVPDADAATCQIGGSIPANGSCSCTFTATVPPGDFVPGANCAEPVSLPTVPGCFPDEVTACANNITDPTLVCDKDPAAVPYLDRPQPPSLTKTVGNTQCQIDVTYTVVVTNGSAQDALTLNTLSDDKYGSITSAHDNVISTTCAVPAQIAPSGNYACSFVGRITSCETTLTDIVTATATDDDGANYTVSGTATIVVKVPSTPQ